MTLPHRHLLRLALTGAAIAATAAAAQSVLTGTDIGETREALAEARKQGKAARYRAERFEIEARRVTEKAERTAREAAAIAARIQEAEADIAASEAQAGLIEKQRDVLRARLAERQQPLIRLTAALQRLSRRPPALALLRPGSTRDTTYMRALLDSILPEVERRTVALRNEIERGRQLERRAMATAKKLRAGQDDLKERRKQLAVLESRQRLASREAVGIAARESERALALAEKALDLGDLVEEIGKQGELRAELAALPGPILRPPRPEDSQVIEATADDASPRALVTYIMPISGRLVAGFGEEIDGRPPSRGIVLAVRGNSQAVAPAPGRVAFAGPYRGYGRIVIIEHDDGWTTLVTGLARLDADVGDKLVAGSPLGLTAPGEPIVTVELRRSGEPVNPLEYAKKL